MGNRNDLVDALVLVASEQKPRVREFLKCLVKQQYTSHIANGKTVISTSEFGGSVTFAFADMLGPAEVVSIALEALRYVEQQPNPDDPQIQKRNIHRLRASFSRGGVL